MVQGRAVVVALAVAAVLAASAGRLRGEEVPSGAIRDDFESDRTAWRQEQTDATISLSAHDRSPLAAHDGRASERFRFAAGPGSAFYFSYALPKIPASDALKVGLYVRSRRPGVRLYGRVILPADTDPDTGQPSFVLVPGTIYENVDRWQRLELGGMRASIERQARVLRASTRRPVPIDGAYLDSLVVNLYGGEGESEVFLDDLAIAPIAPELAAEHAKPRPDANANANTNEKEKAGDAKGPGGARVRLDRNLLRKDGRDWVPTIIQAPGADVARLRNAGFDVIGVDPDTPDEKVRDAIQRGFLLMPSLAGRAGEPSPEPEQVVERAANYPYRDSVALWNLGDRLARSPDPEERENELARIRAIVAGFHRLPNDSCRLTTATVEGEFQKYAHMPQNLDVIGVRPAMWGAAHNPLDIYNYLSQRRSLTLKDNPGESFCAWINATAPMAVQTAIWGHDVPPSWGFLHVQPEQIRLSTYLALSAGYRAIGFRADADLTRTDAGRILLIEMALLNEEIDLFQSILAQGKDPIPFEYTFPPDPPLLPPPGSMNINARPPIFKEYGPMPGLRVASIATADRRGSLLIVGDYMEGAQYQPPQSSFNNAKVMVAAPESAQAFEVSPGGVRPLDRERVPGGTRLTIPEFSETALILVTTDMARVAQLKAQVEGVRPTAVTLAIEQADLLYQWVADINGRLIAGEHRTLDPNDPKNPPPPPGARPEDEEDDLLRKARDSIKTAREAVEREDFQAAWYDARRATQALRYLRYAHWKHGLDAMIKLIAPPPDNRQLKYTRENAREYIRLSHPKKKPPALLIPVASPPLVAFNTLPQHYIWIEWMRKTTFSPNLIPSGSFDNPRAMEKAGWVEESHRYDGIESRIETRPNDRGRDAGRRALKLSVRPVEGQSIDELGRFLDFPAVGVRSPSVRVKTGQFFRISVWVYRPILSVQGVGGIVVRDSIGGEALQFRAHEATPEFSKIVLFRRASADGELSVLLGLAEFGDVYFDDFKVEVVEGPGDVDGASRPHAFMPPRLELEQPPLPNSVVIKPRTSERR